MFKDYMGQELQPIFFKGVVEDDADPLTLGRVKVRVFGIHPEDKSLVPTKDLPWATTLVNSTHISPNIYNRGDWVFGVMLDGKLAQYPIIMGMIPGVTRAGAPGEQGGTNSGYADGNGQGSYVNKPPYHGQGFNTPGTNLKNSSTSGGNNIRDNGIKVHNGNKNSYPLSIYSWDKAPRGFACKDGSGSLNMHYPTALAFESLTKQAKGSAFTINSAYRSESYNAGVGGARFSQHVQGRAIDVSKNGMGDIEKFLELAARNGFVGFGMYNTFIHIDTGSGRVWGGFSDSQMAALKRGGWAPGKPGLQGQKFDAPAAEAAKSANTAKANTAPGATDGSPAADGTTPTRVNPVSDPKTKSEVQDYITNDLKSKGYNDVQVAGVLAHVQHESSFNPNASGDKGAAAGLFQWNDRRPAMEAWTSANGYSPSSVQGQMAFFHHEMATTENGAYRQLSQATTPAEASLAMNSYERFSGHKNSYGGESLNRINTANKIAGGDFRASGDLAGFYDPTNSYPAPNSRGQPTTHEAARGMNSTPYDNVRSGSRAASHSGFPVAGNKGTFGAPESGVAPQYPHNKVYSTNSGHIQEFDDTPGAERVQLTHKSGSYWQMTANGSNIFNVVGNGYMFNSRDYYHGVMGNSYTSVVGDLNIRTTSDITLQSDGSNTELIYGDKSTSVAGKFDILVGGVVQVKAARVIIEADRIDVYSKGKLNIQAEGDLNINSQGKLAIYGKGGVDIKSDADSNLQASGKTSIKSGGNIAQDGAQIRLQEGQSSDAATAPNADSTDLGKAMTKKKIKKEGTPNSHPDAHVTTEQAASVYGTNV